MKFEDWLQEKVDKVDEKIKTWPKFLQGIRIDCSPDPLDSIEHGTRQ